jgi:hypothetical protein
MEDFMPELPTSNIAGIITTEMIPPESFRIFHKSGLTKARPLTQIDFENFKGNIQTLEGPASFKVGDFLAIGVNGEQYPIRFETMASTKQIIGEPDDEGWGNYKTTTTVRATKIDKPFGVQRVGTDDISYGKAGDWFVDSGKRQFIVDDTIFKATYEIVVDESKKTT